MDISLKKKQKILNDLLPKPVIGGGLLNTVIDSLPFPLHAPGTNYLGPGTPLAYNLKRGVKPVNKLDEAAMRHDIAYSKSKDLNDRHVADKILQDEAWSRFKANDSSVLEKIYGLATAGTMRAKRALGAGHGKRFTDTYQKTAVNLDDADLARINNAIAHKSPTSLTIRYKRTKSSVVGETSLPLTNSQVTRLKKAREKKRNLKINLSAAQIAYLTSHNKTGGFLPAAAVAAIPALAALGSLITGGVTAYQNNKANNRLIEEEIRHNKAMEGKGIYIYKKPDIGGNIYKKPTAGARLSGGNVLMNALLKKKLLR